MRWHSSTSVLPHAPNIIVPKASVRDLDAAVPERRGAAALTPGLPAAGTPGCPSSRCGGRSGRRATTEAHHAAHGDVAVVDVGVQRVRRPRRGRRRRRRPRSRSAARASTRGTRAHGAAYSSRADAAAAQRRGVLVDEVVGDVRDDGVGITGGERLRGTTRQRSAGVTADPDRAPDLLRLLVHALVVGELDHVAVGIGERADVADRVGICVRRPRQAALCLAARGDRRRPSPWLGISMPMWANGAMIGCGPLSWSRKKLTSTRMNGLSPWSGWPSQAPWPSASSRRSSSSQRRERLVPLDGLVHVGARQGDVRPAHRAGGRDRRASVDRCLTHSCDPSGIDGVVPPLVHSTTVVPHGSSNAPLKPLNSAQ